MARRFGVLSPMNDTEADAESDALARVIKSLVGGAAFLYELVSGTAVSDDTQVTPPNPQGEIGVDLSGPPWGSALRHPIAWCGGAKPSGAIGMGMTPVIGIPAGERRVLGPWPIWVRPFEDLPSPSVAPYSLGELSMRGHRDGGASAFVSFDVKNLSVLSSPIPSVVDQASFSATEGNIITLTPNSVLMPLAPGWNVLYIGFANGSAVDCYIDSIVINQIKKRSH